MYWGHKACIIGFPGQGIPLDARAMSDAASFDGKSFYPHVEEVLEMHPELKPKNHREAVAIFRSEIVGSLVRQDFDHGDSNQSTPRVWGIAPFSWLNSPGRF